MCINNMVTFSTDPVSMIAMIAILAAGMIILLITACVLICAYRKETCCFKRKWIKPPVVCLLLGAALAHTSLAARRATASRSRLTGGWHNC